MASVLLGLGAALGVLGVAEKARHQRAMTSIPLRIHVNGTRGKSSVTRLIAAGLRASGRRTTAKTTGTLPRLILPDGQERAVFRAGRPNVLEQLRIVRLAAAEGSEALVVECMALVPELQALSELELIQATHGVITNARADHLEIMGPTESDVARALAGTVPRNGVLFTGERRHLHTLEAAARDRGTRLVVAPEPEALGVDANLLGRFRYVEHGANVALALTVLQDLGVARETALDGMWSAEPDPGALTIEDVDFFGRRLVLVNGFAANDPESSLQIWRLALERFPELDRRVLIVNCRADRAERSVQLAQAIATWPRPSALLAIGTGTDLFLRHALHGGFEPGHVFTVSDPGAAPVVEALLELAGSAALLCGVGNIAGVGLELAQFFRRRRRLEQGEGARSRLPARVDP